MREASCSTPSPPPPPPPPRCEEPACLLRLDGGVCRQRSSQRSSHYPSRINLGLPRTLCFTRPKPRRGRGFTFPPGAFSSFCFHQLYYYTQDFGFSSLGSKCSCQELRSFTRLGDCSDKARLVSFESGSSSESSSNSQLGPNQTYSMLP